MKMFIWIFFALIGINIIACSTARPTATARPTTGSSAILTSNASLSTSGVTFSDRQSSTAVTSTSLNGTTTTSKKDGTSANTFSTTVTSTTFISTSVVTSSNKQSSTTLTSTSLNGENGESKHLIIIVAVVVTVFFIAAISVAVFMLHRRRCKKPAGENASNDELPNQLIHHDFTSNKQSPLNFQTVETSNYEQINEKYIATYSIPARRQNDSANEKNDKTNGEAGTIDAYDRIEFAMKCSVKMPNYDSVSALEVKKVDDTYSHISNQSKPASAPTTNDYCHGQYVIEDSQSNDYPYKITITNEARVADNYSHVDIDSDRTKRRQSNIVENDSYNHINIDNTINASRNREAVSVRTIYKSDEAYPTLKDLQSLDVESELWPICDRNSGVSSRNSPLQDIKAVSLPDNYIEFKVGDIYDTPRCKDKQ